MYFSGLAAAISGQQTPLLNSEKSYHLAATGAWQLASQLGNLIQAAADEAIIAGISMAASTAMASTGVGVIGGVAGYGASVLIVARILDKINKISKIINTAGTVIAGAFGVVIDSSAQVGHISDVPLPAAGFSLPQS
jgi:hypothetical protein